MIKSIGVQKQKMMLREYIKEILLNEQENFRGSTFYHGTDGNFLESIAKEGLRVGKPGSATVSGVYMTPTFEKAARYAHGGFLDTGSRGEIPIVLEIYLSGKKRHKKLKYDDLDRHEDAWDENRDWSEMDEIFSSISHGLENIYKKLKIPYKHLYYSDLEKALGGSSFVEIEDLNGINLYKSVFDYLSQRTSRQRSEIIQVIKSEFPPGGILDSNLYISDSGTITLDFDHFQNREQIIYPKKLPPSVIKAVWVRCEDFPDQKFKITSNAGSLKLPHEAKREHEEMLEFANSLRWNKTLMEDSEEDILYYIEKAKEYDAEDLVNALTEFLQTSEDNKQNAAEEVSDMAMYFQDSLHEDWGQESKTQPICWGKLTLNEALWLIHKVQGRQLSFKF